MATRKKKKRNPADESGGAKKLYERFHQKKATKAVVYPRSNKGPADVAELGTVVELHVTTPSKGKFVLKPKGVKLTSTANGKSLYFVGGDQASIPVAAMGGDAARDHVRLGRLDRVVYLTKKGFHDFEPVEYSHHMGEDGGWKPDLCFDTRNRLMYVVDGSYEVKRAGIIR